MRLVLYLLGGNYRFVQWKCLQDNGIEFVPVEDVLEHSDQQKLTAIAIFSQIIFWILFLFGPLIYLKITPDSSEISSAVNFESRITIRANKARKRIYRHGLARPPGNQQV